MKVAIALLLLVAACKSGEGERCQSTDDCQSDLVCNGATDTCQVPGTGGSDGGIRIDARVPLPDAEPVDAALPDASPPDAAPPDAAPPP